MTCTLTVEIGPEEWLKEGRTRSLEDVCDLKQ